MTKENQIAALYTKAFTDFGVIALWNMRPVPTPTLEDALAITDALRVEGTLESRALAYQIEQLCHAP